MALIEDRVPVFRSSGDIWIVGVLSGNIGIDIVSCVRPGVAGQHQEALVETMAQVRIQRVIEAVAIVRVAENLRISWLRSGCFQGIAGCPKLAVERHPQWTGAISGLGR